MSTRRHLFLLVTLLLVVTIPAGAAEKLKALLIDGQNNHDWKGCQPVLKWALEESGRFTVDISTTPPARSPASAWAQWHPNFSDYDVIVSNYNGDLWPKPVRDAFVAYIRNGGGLAVVHAADNSFADWPEYNEMIGVGGWGGRNEKSGPFLYYADGKIVRDTSPGAGGTHGAQHAFLVVTRAPEHPIMKGLPAEWRAAKDELYSRLRGPAENLTVLATAFHDPRFGGTNKNEPVLMTITFGKGRIFHTTLGHGPEAMCGLGFQVTLARGAEWAATGAVTIPAPTAAELTADKAAIRKPPFMK